MSFRQSPLVCVASYSRSHFARVSTYSRSSGLPNDSTIGNIRPLLQVAVVRDGEHAAAGLLPRRPSIHFQRSTGLSLPSG